MTVDALRELGQQLDTSIPIAFRLSVTLVDEGLRGPLLLTDCVLSQTTGVQSLRLLRELGFLQPLDGGQRVGREVITHRPGGLPLDAVLLVLGLHPVPHHQGVAEGSGHVTSDVQEGAIRGVVVAAGVVDLRRLLIAEEGGDLVHQATLIGLGKGLLAPPTASTEAREEIIREGH